MLRQPFKFIAALAAGVLFAGAASAAPVTLVFQNPAADLPVGGNFTTGGQCIGINVSSIDLCTINHAAGLTYSKSWVDVNVVAKSNGAATGLIQDLAPANSGLGALTRGETNADDQVQAKNKESLVFDFGQLVSLLMVDFNSGADRNCANPGNEGPCGTFNLIIDGLLTPANTGLTAIDDMVIASLTGRVFEFVATGPTLSGFAIGRITVDEVPLPGAAVLLLSGLAGLGFAGRRRERQ